VATSILDCLRKEFDRTIVFDGLRKGLERRTDVFGGTCCTRNSSKKEVLGLGSSTRSIEGSLRCRDAPEDEKEAEKGRGKPHGQMICFHEKEYGTDVTRNATVRYPPFMSNAMKIS
jgi:hypothetical protein